jgi:hypothetical protein
MRITCIAALLAAFAAAQPGPFPKTDPQSAFAELKSAHAGWPIVELKEDWDAARRRAESGPAWRAWLAAERAEMDDWAAKRRDNVKWIAGWWHDFVSPKDGSFLTWTPDEPGEYTLSSPSDPRVKLTPKLHGAWVFGFRGRHASKIADAARLYRLTGETRYAEWAASQLDFYAEHFLEWPLKTIAGGTPCCRLAWQSLDEAVNLVKYVTAARLLDPYAAAERRRAWIEKLFRPEAELLDKTMQRIHNIACWQRSAMAHVAIYAGDEDLWRRAIDADNGVRNQALRGITSDYLWFEQSLGYNQYVVSALEPLFRFAALAGRGKSLLEESAATGNLLLAPILLRFPSGQLPNPADSTGGLRRAPSPQTLASFYVLYPTPLGLQRASSQLNWDTLLHPPVAAAAMMRLPEVRSRNLESSRMAILRSGPWQVFFHYGQLDRSHAQAEALNYEAAFNDIDVTHDPGTVGYGSPLHAGFYTKGPAHNVPLIDGEGQLPWRPGALVQFDPQKSIVSARHDEYRPGVSAGRELRIEGDRLIDVTTVELSDAAAPKRLGLALHLQGKIELPGGFAPAESPLPYWENAVAADFPGEALFRAVIGGKPFAVTLRASGPFRLWRAASPDVPPQKRESLYIELRGASARFEAVLEPASR